MHRLTVPAALAALLASSGLALAQTPEIQKQVNKKLSEAKKEEKAKASELDELLAQALKNNPDIRVAESKLREAEAELYRARMMVLGRVTMLRNEIVSAKAA